MTVHLHHLTGCTPVPLAGYLKALGILRLIAEQKDASARGWWQDEHFCLLCSLDAQSLKRFFLEQYAPTPVFNPWGARSGYYPDSSEKSARQALETIANSHHPRFQAFRDAIQQVRRAVSDCGGVKPVDEGEKAALLGLLSHRVRGGGRDWLSAVMTVVGEAYRAPAILGTGGNEGSGSYTSAFLEVAVECLLTRSQDAGLLLGEDGGQALSPAKDHLWGGTFGQFVPDGRAAAWDLLLAIEGAILFSASVVTRSNAGTSDARFASSPFYFSAHSAGAGSMSDVDEYALNKGRRNPGRGEQWFPLWQLPTTLDEIGSLLGEGRCAVGRRAARSAMDAALAANRLGVSRGISSFIRYGYLQRNNQATHFAVPLGRVEVRTLPSSRLLDELDEWSRRVKRYARDSNAATRLVVAERVLADSIFSVLTHDDSPWRWQAVLQAAVEIESIQASGTAFKAGPIPPLSHGWLDVTNDGTAEWRLACALASAAADYSAGVPRDGVRRHWLPLDGSRYATREDRLIADPGVVAGGRDPVGDLIAVVGRRLVEASQQGQRYLPLRPAPGRGARPEDIAQWLSGAVDDAKVAGLARALMAVRWHTVPVPTATRGETSDGVWPEEAWQVVWLASLSGPLDANRAIPVDRAIVSRLQSGDAATAVNIALRRLRGAGLVPRLHAACADSPLTRRWAAALAFPISPSLARHMASRLESTVTKENR